MNKRWAGEDTNAGEPQTVEMMLDFKALFESSPSLKLVLDAGFKIIAVTDAYLRATMTERALIIGRGIFEVFPASLDNPGADSVKNLRASLERVLRTLKPDPMAVQRYDIRHPDLEGGQLSVRYWSPFNSPVLNPDGTLACIIHRVEDVTEFVMLEQRMEEGYRQNAELQQRTAKMEVNIRNRSKEMMEANTNLKKLEQTQRQLVAIIESSTDAIISKDLEGKINSWNLGAQRIFGYSSAEAIGQPMTMLLPPDKLDEEFQILARIARGEIVDHFQTVRRAKDGRLIDISATVSPVRDEAGQVIGASKIARNISDQKRAERLLRESETRLKELFENLRSGVAVFVPSEDGQQFRLQSLNHAGERIENTRIEKAMGQYVQDVYPGLIGRGLLDVFKKVWRHGVAQHVPISLYNEGHITGWRENYVYKLPQGEIIVIYDDITHEKQEAEKILHRANYDALTGLPNRTLLSDRFQQALVIAKRNKVQLATMFIDLDNFKPVNDTLGHDVGDALLKAVAYRMLNCVRESDTVARVGGDEFVLLLPEIETENDAVIVAEKIRYTLNQPFELGGHTVVISGSIGLAVYPQHGTSENLLAKSADTAMYQAKAHGRNCVALFHEESLGKDALGNGSGG